MLNRLLNLCSLFVAAIFVLPVMNKWVFHAYCCCASLICWRLSMLYLKHLCLLGKSKLPQILSQISFPTWKAYKIKSSLRFV